MRAVIFLVALLAVSSISIYRNAVAVDTPTVPIVSAPPGSGGGGVDAAMLASAYFVGQASAQIGVPYDWELYDNYFDGNAWISNKLAGAPSAWTATNNLPSMWDRIYQHQYIVWARWTNCPDGDVKVGLWYATASYMGKGASCHTDMYQKHNTSRVRNWRFCWEAWVSGDQPYVLCVGWPEFAIYDMPCW